MNEVIVNLIAAAVMLTLAVSLNQCSNDKFEAKCTAKGGTYYKAIDSSKSLCKMGDQQ